MPRLKLCQLCCTQVLYLFSQASPHVFFVGGLHTQQSPGVSFALHSGITIGRLGGSYAYGMPGIKPAVCKTSTLPTAIIPAMYFFFLSRFCFEVTPGNSHGFLLVVLREPRSVRSSQVPSVPALLWLLLSCEKVRTTPTRTYLAHWVGVGRTISHRDKITLLLGG